MDQSEHPSIHSHSDVDDVKLLLSTMMILNELHCDVNHREKEDGLIMTKGFCHKKL